MKIVSGGQTGVDRAALDVALELGLPCGGWCPQGRRAEDGRIPDRYPLRETTAPFYPQRTRLNVRDAEGTLILTRGEPTGGTALTLQIAAELGKPRLVIMLCEQPEPEEVHGWLTANQLAVLNGAGPRESECPGIHDQAAAFLRRVLAQSGG